MFRFTPILVIVACAILYGCSSSEKEPKQGSLKSSPIQRYGQVIKVKPEKLDYYKELHANPWPCVLEKIRECNIQNYSIFLQDDHLFAYFEYVGGNFKEDMEKMAVDSCTQKWWKETDPCQEPVLSAKPGEWWTTMEEVFHSD